MLAQNGCSGYHSSVRRISATFSPLSRRGSGADVPRYLGRGVEATGTVW